jgi:hypothetical protein
MNLMNVNDPISFVNDLIEKHRIEIGDRPATTPVAWRGLNLTIEEAKFLINELEAKKKRHQEIMNGTQTGGEITSLATQSAGLLAMMTGVALLLFPPTAIAGAAVLVSGAGTTGIGKMVGQGIQDIGEKSNQQIIRQIDDYISSLKNSLIATL